MRLEGPSSAGLMYSDSGGDGPVVVLLHGVLMNGTLWDDVVDRRPVALPPGTVPLRDSIAG